MGPEGRSTPKEDPGLTHQIPEPPKWPLAPKHRANSLWQVERFWVLLTCCKIEVQMKCCFVFPSDLDNVVEENQRVFSGG